MNPLNVRVDTDQDCVTWLALHGYPEVVNTIQSLTRKWTDEGKTTRRDWWLILAGTPSGKHRRVNGIVFPILKAARRRQGFPPDVVNARENTPHELAPSIKRQERWGKGFKRALK